MKTQLMLFETVQAKKQSVATVWPELPEEEKESVKTLLAELMVRSVRVQHESEATSTAGGGRDDE